MCISQTALQHMAGAFRFAIAPNRYDAPLATLVPELVLYPLYPIVFILIRI